MRYLGDMSYLTVLMQDWINTEIEYDGEDKFWSQENPELLFSYFFDTFHSENADAVFAHASFKWIISSPPGQDGSLDGASRWTKGVLQSFINIEYS